jgi:hypothetical protein
MWYTILAGIYERHPNGHNTGWKKQRFGLVRERLIQGSGDEAESQRHHHRYKDEDCYI